MCVCVCVVSACCYVYMHSTYGHEFTRQEEREDIERTQRGHSEVIEDIARTQRT